MLFLSNDSNNFTLDTVSGLEKYAIQQAMDDCLDIVGNKVALKYKITNKITKFQRQYIESLYSEGWFMMATMGLRVGKAPTDDKPAVVPLVEPGPPAAEAASPAVSAEAVPVSMTKRKMTVQGLYDPKADELVVLRGSPINLVTPVLEKDKAAGPKRQALLDKGQLIDNGNGTGTPLVDVPLPSPTAAAQFAFGGSINGRKYWKVGDGKSIKGVWE